MGSMVRNRPGIPRTKRVLKDELHGNDVIYLTGPLFIDKSAVVDWTPCVV